MICSIEYAIPPLQFIRLGLGEGVSSKELLDTHPFDLLERDAVRDRHRKACSSLLSVGCG